MIAVMTTATSPTGRDDPLYLRARQIVLFRRDPGIATLQRALRIGHQHATALRDALCGDILEYHAHDASWHIAKGVDMAHDPLLDHKLAQAAEWIGNASGEKSFLCHIGFKDNVNRFLSPRGRDPKKRGALWEPPRRR